MKKILMIAYSFPPIAGGGVFRTLKFVKYLPTFEWQPIVLSIKKTKYKNMDKSLLKEIPDIVKTYRTITLENKVYRHAGSFFGFNPKWYQIPCATFFEWYIFAVQKAKKIIKEEKPDVIYSTSPPITSLLIGLTLKQKIGLPWIIDFRDPWTQNFSKKYPSDAHKKFEEKLEKKVLIHADKIIVNTEANRIDLLKKYPDITKDKCIVITNGYDPEDFEDVKKSKTSKFTIANVGSFYGSMNPENFLKAIQQLLTEKPNIKDKIKIVFAGHNDKKTTNLLKTTELKEIIDKKGYVSYKKSIEIMTNSDILLYILPSNNRDAERVLAQRIFNYLAAQKPILGLVPDGESANLIKKTNSGVVVDPQNIEEIKQTISSMYDKWEQNTLHFDSNNSEVKKYDRRELIKMLTDAIEEIV